MIDSFKDEHDWLSNFYIEESGSSVEHWFQAAKADNIKDTEWILDSPTPATAKKRGKQIRLRKDWEEVKLTVMERLLRFKFENKELRDKLLATGNEELIEGNWWGDTYWGVCNGIGENHLGKLLMKIRQEIRNAAVTSSN